MKKFWFTMLVCLIGMSFLSKPAASEPDTNAIIRVVEALFTEQVQQGTVPSFSTTVNMTANLTAGSVTGKISGFYNGPSALFFCNGNPSSATTNTEYSYNFSGTINPGNGAFTATILPSGVADILSGPCNGNSFGWSGNGTLSGTINTFTGETEIRTNWTAGSALTTGLWLGRSYTENGVDVVLFSDSEALEVCQTSGRSFSLPEACFIAELGQNISLVSQNELLINLKKQQRLKVACLNQASGFAEIMIILFHDSAEKQPTIFFEIYTNIFFARLTERCETLTQNRDLQNNSIKVGNENLINFEINDGKLSFQVKVDELPISVNTPSSTIQTANKNNFSVLINENNQNNVSILAFSGYVEVTPKNSSLSPFTLNSGETTLVTTTEVGPIMQLQHIFLPITVR